MGLDPILVVTGAKKEDGFPFIIQKGCSGNHGNTMDRSSSKKEKSFKSAKRGSWIQLSFTLDIYVYTHKSAYPELKCYSYTDSNFVVLFQANMTTHMNLSLGRVRVYRVQYFNSWVYYMMVQGKKSFWSNTLDKDEIAGADLLTVIVIWVVIKTRLSSRLFFSFLGGKAF